MMLNNAANNLRVLIAEMVEKSKSGHPGGAMGGADFINVLYSSFLVYDPADPKWFARDRFFLDPGHMSPMLYSILALTGKFTIEDLQNFRQWGSVTPGHPEVDVERGIENTSGPLGQGHVMAVGAAIAINIILKLTRLVRICSRPFVISLTTNRHYLFKFFGAGGIKILDILADYPRVLRISGPAFNQCLRCY